MNPTTEIGKVEHSTTFYMCTNFRGVFYFVTSNGAQCGSKVPTKIKKLLKFSIKNGLNPSFLTSEIKLRTTSSIEKFIKDYKREIRTVHRSGAKELPKHLV